MSVRHIINSALVALAAFAAACGGGSDLTGPGGGGSTPTPTPSANKGTLTITNAAPTGSAMFIRTRACGASGSWSSDLLAVDGNGAGGIMFPGEAGTWQLAPGCYDVRVTPSEAGLDYLYFNSVQLTAGQTTALTITSFPLAQ